MHSHFVTGAVNNGVTAIGARVIDPGTIAYFPPSWAVYSTSGESVTMLFGDVNNVDTEPTDVIIELVYAIDPTVPTSEIDLRGLTQTIGGVDFSDDIVFDVVLNVKREIQSLHRYLLTHSDLN